MMDLQTMESEWISSKQRIAALEAENSELITVMHRIVRMAEICHLEWGDMRLDKITNLARSTIAKVKESK